MRTFAYLFLIASLASWNPTSCLAQQPTGPATLENLLDSTPTESSAGAIGHPYYATWKKSPDFFSKEFVRRGLPSTTGNGIFLFEPTEDFAGLVTEGLHPEDIVIRLNGVHLKDEESLTTAITSLRAGTSAKASIKRVDAARKKWEMKIIEVVPVAKAKIDAVVEAQKQKKELADKKRKQEYLTKEFTLTKGGTKTGAELDAWNAEQDGASRKFATTLKFDEVQRWNRALKVLRSLNTNVGKGDKKLLRENMAIIRQSPGLAGDITWLVDDTPLGGLVTASDDGRALHFREVWVEALLEVGK